MNYIDLIYQRFIDLFDGLELKGEWKNHVPEEGGISVYYGRSTLPGRDQKTGGGIIKCQDLAQRFQNSRSGANILYLVSSALPPGAEYMVKYARSRGVKVVLNQNGVAYKGWHGAGWKIANMADASILRKADYVFYQSSFCKLAADKFAALRSADYEILYNPVDTSVFRPRDMERPSGEILLAGSHHAYYRIDTALRAMVLLLKEMPDVKLRICGRYAWCKDEQLCLNEVRHSVEALGLSRSVLLEGSYSQSEAPSIIRSADVLLHTKYNDPCPRLVVEAMASGVPVVYSSSGGVSELVGEEAGIGVPAALDWAKDHPPDPVELASALKKVLSDRSRFAANARQRAVQMFDVEAWLKRHEQVFNGLIKGAC